MKKPDTSIILFGSPQLDELMALYTYYMFLSGRGSRGVDTPGGSSHSSS